MKCPDSPEQVSGMERNECPESSGLTVQIERNMQVQLSGKILRSLKIRDINFIIQVKDKAK
jgi:hypothetical protein